MWRPLIFASADPDVAAARGVPVRALSPVFTVILALAVSVAIQVVGALLVLALVVTPAAAAMRVTASPRLVPLLGIAFAVTSMIGGILLALGSSIPIRPIHAAPRRGGSPCHPVPSYPAFDGSPRWPRKAPSATSRDLGTSGTSTLSRAPSAPTTPQ
ncbi:metal ABC transporter permease [Nonomuraea angiospora]|uniref:metal ABC transporter permease n=1 Tax=Nonomuraea angiospora TaxID=46172 RepID=UPI003796A0EA